MPYRDSAILSGRNGTWNGILFEYVLEVCGVDVSQTSLTIARSNGYPLGAVTIEINVDAFK